MDNLRCDPLLALFPVSLVGVRSAILLPIVCTCGAWAS